MKTRIGNDWDRILTPFTQSQAGQKLFRWLDTVYAEKTVYPQRDRVFSALEITPPERVRAVIMGQDPYYRAGQAHGLALSVPRGVPVPPSLRNMFTELESDLGLTAPAHGDLTAWAKQGVLLLNTVLTVEDGKPNAHAGYGWEIFTDSVISYLGQNGRPIAFCLWGKPAQKKEALLSGPLVLKAPHPSPLSAYRGFFGSRPYSRINAYLRSHGLPEINWQIT
jgi:uracil-DNA glycosylase